MVTVFISKAAPDWKGMIEIVMTIGQKPGLGLGGCWQDDDRNCTHSRPQYVYQYPAGNECHSDDDDEYDEGQEAGYEAVDQVKDEGNGTEITKHRLLLQACWRPPG
jgi:hypothetical protein